MRSMVEYLGFADGLKTNSSAQIVLEAKEGEILALILD